MMDKRRVKQIFTTEELFDYFEDTVGSKAWQRGLPKAALVEYNPNQFKEFLRQLTPIRRNRLSRALQKYDKYTNAIREKVHLNTNYQLMVLFGLIEVVMRSKRYLSLDEYLRKQFKRNVGMTKVEYCTHVDEYHDKYGSGRSIKQFFTKYLREEMDQIIAKFKYYPEWRDCKTVKQFVDQVSQFRHKFVHQLDIDSLWPYDKKMKRDERFKAKWRFEQTVSIMLLTRLTWVGIFRRYGFKGLL